MRQRMSWITVLLLLTLGLSAQVKFKEQPVWNDLLATAKAEHKFIFVDCYTNWCGWCKIMDKTTFKNPVVTYYMDKNFVSARYEMETGFGCNLAMKFNVASFPTYLVLSPEGKYIDALYGFSDSVKFVKSLKEIVATPESNYPTGISSQIDLPFPDIYRKRFLKDDEGHHTYADSATTAAYLATQKDLTNEVAWNVLRASGVALKPYSDWILANDTTLKRLYGKNIAGTMFSYAINFKFLAVSNRNDEVALEKEIFPLVDKYMPDEKATQKVFFNFRFYHSNKNYEKYLMAIKEFDEFVKKGEGNPELIFIGCSDLYQECNDERILREACAVMKEFNATQPRWANYITYGSLLYKIKDYKEAEAVANKGIEVGLKAKEDVSELQKLLEQIKTAEVR